MTSFYLYIDLMQAAMVQNVASLSMLWTNVLNSLQRYWKLTIVNIVLKERGAIRLVITRNLAIVMLLCIFCKTMPTP